MIAFTLRTFCAFVVISFCGCVTSGVNRESFFWSIYYWSALDVTVLTRNDIGPFETVETLPATHGSPAWPGGPIVVPLFLLSDEYFGDISIKTYSLKISLMAITESHLPQEPWITLRKLHAPKASTLWPYDSSKRSDVISAYEYRILMKNIEWDQVQEIELSGEQGVHLVKDYRGIPSHGYVHEVVLVPRPDGRILLVQARHDSRSNHQIALQRMIFMQWMERLHFGRHTNGARPLESLPYIPVK